MPDAAIVLALLAQATPATDAVAKANAATPDPPQINVTRQPRQDGCTNPNPTEDTRQIVICAPRPQGYRLNPDVLEARREVRGGGGPKRPENYKDYPCASGVGPAPCMTAGISLIGVALTAAEMAKRAVEGKNVGEMFITDPHPTEYQLYLMAKARREAREAEEAAAAYAARPAEPKAQAEDTAKDE